MTTPRDVLRIGNISGYYGDRLEAAKEVIAAGVDVLTGDYLAELTMLILWKARRRDPSHGYAKTFLTQMEQVLGTCMDKGTRIVTNAGGLNPGGLADELRLLSERLGLSPRIAYIQGDDVVARIPDWLRRGIDLPHLDTGESYAASGVEAITANAYLGGWGIRRALDEGADIVVCPRVTDAALVIGPSAWAFEWSRTDYDRLAGAVVAGHVLECGAQATGGNYSFFRELRDFRRPGFPIAEMHPDGSCIVTKPEGSGGTVNVDTVKAQLLYEISGPLYPNPDVVARFDTIALEQDGPDRVRISGTKGEGPTGTLKIALNYSGGYRNEMTMVITGLDIDEKAGFALAALRSLWGDIQFDTFSSELRKADLGDVRSNEDACSMLRVMVKDADRDKAGRTFSNAFVQAALSSYPGFFLMSPPSGAEEFGVYWPTLIPAGEIAEQVVLWDGRTIEIEVPRFDASAPIVEAPMSRHVAPTGEEMVELPLGRLFGTRSGDKGGNANLGVWARAADAHAWLASELTVARLKALLPDLAAFEITRHEFPNLLALNFVVHGLLDKGVAASMRLDRQAKGLGEYLGCRPISVPRGIAGNNS